MYIKFELYRSKYPDEMFKAEMIQWDLKTDKDLIEIDTRMRDVLATHIKTIPEVQKYGMAYIGRMKIVEIEILDSDDLGGIDEEHFKAYINSPDVMPYLNVVWSKNTESGDDSNV